MPSPRSNEPRLTDAPSAMHKIASRPDATFDDLSTDELAIIFGFLDPFDIMRSRLCRKLRMAATTAVVPMFDFRVKSVGNYNALVAMSTALPNLQQISLFYRLVLGRHKYVDGEDPNETMAAVVDDFPSLGINFISNFRKLRTLVIIGAPLNGRYPVFFNNFQLLQKLVINSQGHLIFDLDMLAGFPILKELQLSNNLRLTGNINSLRVLKETLAMVGIEYCENVQGNFMDLADFAGLKKLNLSWTAVTGDIRDICNRDFLAIEELALPNGVYGGIGFEFQRISDAPDVISTLYPIMKRRPVLRKHWYGALSEDSPEWYEGMDEEEDDVITAPLCIEFVQAGSRVGYRWFARDSFNVSACEVIWLDPEPGSESSDYEKYIEELQKIEGEVNLFEGYQQPPSEHEYRSLSEARFREEFIW